MNVLVIENNSESASALLNTLKTLNYNVRLVQSGEEGFKEATTGNFDLIFLLAEIFDINGYLLCKKIKEEPKARQIPLILASENPDCATVFEKHKSLKTRADSYIKKPYLVDVVVREIDRFFKSRVTIGSGETEYRKEIERLARELETSRSNSNSFAKELDSIKRENIKLREETDSVKEEVTKTSFLSTENKELKNVIEEKNKILYQKDEEIKKIALGLENFKTQIESIRGDFETRLKSKDEMLNSLKEFYQPKLEELSELKNKFEEQKKNNEKTFNELLAKKERLYRVEEKLKKRDEEFSNIIQNKDKELRELKELYEKEKGEIRAYYKPKIVRINELEEESKRVTKKLEETQKMFDSEIKKADRRIWELSNIMDGVKRDKNKNESELFQTQAEIKKLKMLLDEKEREIESIKAIKEEIRTTIDSLQSYFTNT